MQKQADGFWTVTTTPLVPGLHYYMFVIDGAEVADTGSHAFFGGGKHASAVEVPEPNSTYYSIQDVPHGQVREIWYHSKVTGSWDMRSFIFLQVTRNKTKLDFLFCICSMAVVRMKLDGSVRVVPTSSWTT